MSYRGKALLLVGLAISLTVLNATSDAQQKKRTSEDNEKKRFCMTRTWNADEYGYEREVLKAIEQICDPRGALSVTPFPRGQGQGGAGISDGHYIYCACKQDSE